MVVWQHLPDSANAKCETRCIHYEPRILSPKFSTNRVHCASLILHFLPCFAIVPCYAGVNGLDITNTIGWVELFMKKGVVPLGSRLLR